MPAQISDLQDIFKNVVSAALAFAGIALFVMLTVGGFQYLTSGGDPKQAEGAQKNHYLCNWRFAFSIGFLSDIGPY